tara:strand:- start:3130 stop:4344 length:1215 start_codon:yes stop_codon:yes gene_type:complete
MKKSRIYINTNFKIYFNLFYNFIFNVDLSKKLLNELKNYFKKENLLLTSQGRSAAYEIFKTIINGDKNEIILSPLTLPAVVNSIIYAGGKPIFVDLCLKTGLPNIDNVKHLINKKTAGILITHLYSNEIHLNNFINVFDGVVKIVEDTAINLGSKKSNGDFLGLLCDFGFFSFGLMKNVNSFNGGLIYAKSNEDFSNIKKSMEHNVKFPNIRFLKILLLSMFIDIIYNKFIYYIITINVDKILRLLNINFFEKIIYPGLYPNLDTIKPSYYNYNYCNIFAYSGLYNLNNVNIIRDKRQKKVELYEKYLDNKFLINEFQNYNINAFLELPIFIKNSNSIKISKILFENGYDIRHTWYPNCNIFFNYNGSFENCDNLQKKILCLPTNDNFYEEDIKKISKIINKNG